MKVCALTGKKKLYGNNVAHSNQKTRRVFLPNLVEKRFFISDEDLKRYDLDNRIFYLENNRRAAVQNNYITLRISTSALRTIDKKGIAEVLRGYIVDGIVKTK